MWKRIIVSLWLAGTLCGQDERALDLLKQADEFFEATAYDTAISLYRRVLEGGEDLGVRRKLATALFLAEEYPKAIESLDRAIDQDAGLTKQEELFYLKGLAALKLAELDATYFPIAEEALKLLTKGELAEKSLYLLGTLSFKKGDYLAAQAYFKRVFAEHPQSLQAGDALFWSARASDYLNDLGNGREMRKRCYELYPQCDSAPEAYFTTYSYAEYLQGGRQTMKHLYSLSEKYPLSHFNIVAWVLIGLDYQRDRKTPEGKWLRKRSLTSAIEAFQAAESAFERHQGSMSPALLNHYIPIYCRAAFERALANVGIADESQGAKKVIFLNYAVEVLLGLLNDPHLQQVSKLTEEVNLSLCEVYIKLDSDSSAEKILLAMLHNYKETKVTRGYFLSRVEYELGVIAFRRQDYSAALARFQNAEESAKGNLLSSDQKLELWIQQSHCYRAMQDFDHALLLLSKAVNDPAVSSLRLQAMYLRAEVYELQNRLELARRQLDVIAKQEGEWSTQAKRKLERMKG